MIDISKIVNDVMVADAQLLTMLGENSPYWNKEISPAKQYSIYPAGLAPMNAICPFITVQGGVMAKEGKHLLSETVYIRVYNSKEMSYYKINQIAERLIELFDEQVFELENRAMVRSLFDSGLQEAEDQAMGKNFREIRFKFYVI